MNARAHILSRLQAAPKAPVAEPDTAAHYARLALPDDRPALLRRWAAAMRAARTEVVWTRAHDWPTRLRQLVEAHGIGSLLVPDTADGAAATAALAGSATRTCRFAQPLEQWKSTLFNAVDAGLTGCDCGIADTGSLVLLSSPSEPRSMSLVPPVHIVLFDTRTLYPNLFAAMHARQWRQAMPTNLVLVSGPSKTADIQLTLAYGAHGPKTLIVLACLPDDMADAQLEEAQP